MTAERRNLWLRIAAVAAAQAAVLGWMIWDRAHLLASGREIVLEIEELRGLGIGGLSLRLQRDGLFVQRLELRFQVGQCSAL